MITKIIAFAALFAASSAPRSFAQMSLTAQPAPARPIVAVERSAAANESRARTVRRASDSSTSTTSNSEVYENVFVDAGKTVSIDSKLDYSAAATVAVGIQCTICDSTATSLGASGLVLLARWATPNAEMFVTTENKTATLFPYWDAGGVIFNVYGSQFRLSLQNKGPQAIAIEQVTIFRRGI